MKLHISIISLLFATVVFSQNKIAEDTNCLAVVKLKYKILDSNAIKAIEFSMINIEYINILSYISKEHTYVAYYNGDKNKWISFQVPFTEVTNDFEFVYPASNKGNLLIVKGMKTKSEIRGRSEYRVHNNKMLIINIDKEPTLIFEATYGCDAAVIPSDGANKANYSYDKYERKMNLTDFGLIISTPVNNGTPPEGCKISDIADGTYLFDGVELKKKK